MTNYQDSKTGPTYSVEQRIRTKDEQTKEWVWGTVKEVGDETILVKWDDIKDPTEYNISEVELQGDIFFE